ncbi:hypothetical protein ACFV85_28340 [Streptomyces niveus]|uniref:hypothetical protein n=1 Tax=Streptomyces niveus TaxID=193462 RepID=UPI0035DFE279
MKYFLYGATGSMWEVVEDLSSALGVKFEERDSSYKGGKYFLAHGEGLQEISVESNWEDEEGFAAEPNFKEYPILVYFNGVGDKAWCLPSGSRVIVLLRVDEI